VTATQTRRAAGTGRWRRRWHRVAIPVAVFVLLAGVTWVARSVEEPDLGEAATLSPTGTGGDGSSRLAEMLVERGVRIEPVADIFQAEEALDSGGDAVVFVPKSTLFGAALAGIAAYGGRDHRVVLVAPSAFELAASGLPVDAGRTRWASADREPGCTVPEAVAAGRATALRGRFSVENESQVCYDGGLVRAQVGDAEAFVVGSTDPFRNRRIGEHGNARLAVELLAARDRVIWAGALPFEADFDLSGDLDAPDRGERSRVRDCGFACLFEGYPRPVLIGLSLAGVLALLLAFALARRLGPPVSEPLPVVVPAAEAVAGRGRLYQRTRGRGVAVTALRAAALQRIIRALSLPPAPPPDPETVVAAAAARTGLPADHVRRTLYGPAPETDEDLANAVAALDALVAAVTLDRPAPQGETR
jgi:hypothetical protein